MPDSRISRANVRAFTITSSPGTGVVQKKYTPLTSTAVFNTSGRGVVALTITSRPLPAEPASPESPAAPPLPAAAAPPVRKRPIPMPTPRPTYGNQE